MLVPGTFLTLVHFSVLNLFGWLSSCGGRLGDESTSVMVVPRGSFRSRSSEEGLDLGLWLLLLSIVD